MSDASSGQPTSLEQLVFEALEADATGGDPAVEDLLAHHPRAAAAVRARLRAMRELGLLRTPSAPLPDHIGRYRIRQRIGSGGMGTVYLADDPDVGRLVAVKVVRSDLAALAPGTPAARDAKRRFELEWRALAAMNHRCIARVFDAGVTAAGEPFFAMELVVGAPITVWCDAARLPIDDRLRLLQQVCHGVHHAHVKGIVHRDLKPGNVLVTADDGDAPTPRILDFGLAKALDRDFADAALRTEQDRMLGTPEYMAPEQARGDVDAIDARTDMHALGVMLYELLTGGLPFPSEQLRAGGQSRCARILCEQEPPRPSERATHEPGAAQRAARRRTSPAALRRRLAGDLDWIVGRAMAKEPARRYASAAELAADIDRHLAHEPVAAGPPSARYRIGRFVRRHRAAVVGASLAFAALLVGGVATLVQYVRAESNAAELGVKIDEFDQLSAAVQLDRVLASERELFPPFPDRIAAMEAWLADECGPLLDLRPRLADTVARLRADDRTATHHAAAARTPRERDSRQFLADTLQRTLERLDRVAREEQPSVCRRIAWARRVGELTEHHPNARTTWATARAAVTAADGVLAHARYRTVPIDLVPQVGLVPIGMNPATKLWEFYDLRSACDGSDDPADIDIPRHREDGSIDVGPATGIVFVLVPGGEYRMGAQNADAAAPNHDPWADAGERVRTVAVAPFLLARHELTVAQYARLSRAAGSAAPLPAQVAVLPVAELSWFDARRVAFESGAALPSEAEWEYGCRADTSTPWWTGAGPDTLFGAANVYDRSAAHMGWQQRPEPFDDGAVERAPVGRLRANAFGLYDVHGNVWEWCADARPKNDRPYRGGAFSMPASAARSAGSGFFAPEITADSLGVRLCRPLRRAD